MASMMSAATLLGIDSLPIEGFNREKVEAYLSARYSARLPVNKSIMIKGALITHCMKSICNTTQR